MGIAEGLALGRGGGEELGRGVGLPAVYVGVIDGLTVGVVDGDELGRGVGLPAV